MSKMFDGKTRTQPRHPLGKSLTALLREARDAALEEAAKEMDGWGDIYGDNAARAIRALKDKP